MKSIREMQKFPTKNIDYSRLQDKEHRPIKFTLSGELGFRLYRSTQRIEEALPYSKEYILSQVFSKREQWTNYPRFHGDIAGRWILAETYAHSAEQNPPDQLKEIIDSLLEIQNEDGSFGFISYEENPLNMQKAYGNGWTLKALSQYAFTFRSEEVKRSACRLGEYYINTFETWRQAGLTGREAKYYAVSINCYYHVLDGLLTLFRLTNNARYLNLIEKFIPQLPSLDDSLHAHMYLSVRRGLLAYYKFTGNKSHIDSLQTELKRVYKDLILESGGVPECFWPNRAVQEDEACALFDWLILTMSMHEATEDCEWLYYGILNLENHIYYNQIYNGGFGSYHLGDTYWQQGKEAPWCCSLFGPFGLIEAGSLLVQKKGETVEINHLVSGEFTFDGGETIRIKKDDEKSFFYIDVSDAPSINKISIFNPFWLEFTGITGNVIDERFIFDISGLRVFHVSYTYRLWVSNKGKSPNKKLSFKEGESVVLFYGPWMLCHRFPSQTIQVKLDLNEDGFVTNDRKDYLLGINYYGESVRVIIPTNRTFEPTNPELGVFEKPGELYLYPLRDKESPSHAASAVCAYREYPN